MRLEFNPLQTKCFVCNESPFRYTQRRLSFTDDSQVPVEGNQTGAEDKPRSFPTEV